MKLPNTALGRFCARRAHMPGHPTTVLIRQRVIHLRPRPSCEGGWRDGRRVLPSIFNVRPSAMFARLTFQNPIMLFTPHPFPLYLLLDGVILMIGRLVTSPVGCWDILLALFGVLGFGSFGKRGRSEMYTDISTTSEMLIVSLCVAAPVKAVEAAIVL